MYQEQQKPTVLFVHGSWHQPSHFARVRKVLEDADFPTSCPLQPSIGSLPPIGLMEDAQCIRDELKGLIEDESKDVIVVAHSYGGLVTTQAVDEAFGKKQREERGQNGGVVQLHFMCAFMLSINTSLADTFDGNLPPWIVMQDDGMCEPQNPGDVFYHDLQGANREAAIASLGKSPTITHFTALTHLAYLYHPVTYLYCTEDKALPFVVQRMIVDNGSRQYGVKFGEENCGASHSRFLSMPDKVLEVVQHVIRRRYE
ncbi:putative AB hydrolase-1 domain-containing protein [Seiridium cardinale]